MSAVDCGSFADLAPDLALGTLSGRERAAGLEHLAGCPACRRELDALTRTLEGLLSVAPAVEAPAGFAASVLAGFPTAGPPRAGSPGAPDDEVGAARRRRVARALVTAAAALLLVAGIGAVVASARSDRGTAPAPAASSSSAALRTPAGVAVGRVAVERGERSRLVVTLADGAPAGKYRVQCDYESGGPYAAGTLVARGGSSRWTATVTVPTYDLRRVRLVSTGTAPNLEADLAVA